MDVQIQDLIEAYQDQIGRQASEIATLRAQIKAYERARVPKPTEEGKGGDADGGV